MPVPETPEQLITEEMNRLRGRLCGLIESWGLPDKQERGAISTLKSLSYDSQEVISEVVQDLEQRVLTLGLELRSREAKQ